MGADAGNRERKWVIKLRAKRLAGASNTGDLVNCSKMKKIQDFSWNPIGALAKPQILDWITVSNSFPHFTHSHMAGFFPTVLPHCRAVTTKSVGGGRRKRGQAEHEGLLFFLLLVLQCNPRHVYAEVSPTEFNWGLSPRKWCTAKLLKLF